MTQAIFWSIQFLKKTKHLGLDKRPILDYTTKLLNVLLLNLNSLEKAK